MYDDVTHLLRGRTEALIVHKHARDALAQFQHVGLVHVCHSDLPLQYLVCVVCCYIYIYA